MGIPKKKKSTLHRSHLIDTTLQGLSPIQTIMKMAEEQNIRNLGLNPDSIISFGGGWCNHYAPDRLREIYCMLAADQTWFHKTGRYSAIIGDLQCRQQLARFEEKIYHISDLDENNILLGHSSTQLFHDVLRVVCDPGTPVCVLDPTYANYLNAIKCALPRSEIQFISALDPTTWSYLPDPTKSLEELKNYCSQGARVLIIPVPDNPTSQIPAADFLQACYEIMEDTQGYLILDHAYKALWFDDMPTCFSWSPTKKPHLISLHTNSKWLSSLGRRFGWIEADAEIIQGLEKINESVLLSPDTMHSMATAQFLEKTLDDGSLYTFIEETRLLYKSTAEVMIQGIDSFLGWKRLTPQGGLYTCCPTPSGEDCVSFIEKVLQHTGVLLIPGRGFGPSLEHGVRLSYGPLCYDHNKIVDGLKRIGEFIGTKL